MKHIVYLITIASITQTAHADTTDNQNTWSPWNIGKQVIADIIVPATIGFLSSSIHDASKELLIRQTGQAYIKNLYTTKVDTTDYTFRDASLENSDYPSYAIPITKIGLYKKEEEVQKILRSDTLGFSHLHDIQKNKFYNLSKVDQSEKDTSVLNTYNIQNHVASGIELGGFIYSVLPGLFFDYDGYKTTLILINNRHLWFRLAALCAGNCIYYYFKPLVH
jgi:hypothetical protein